MSVGPNIMSDDWLLWRSLFLRLWGRTNINRVQPEGGRPKATEHGTRGVEERRGLNPRSPRPPFKSHGSIEREEEEEGSFVSAFSLLSSLIPRRLFPLSVSSGGEVMEERGEARNGNGAGQTAAGATRLPPDQAEEKETPEEEDDMGMVDGCALYSKSKEQLLHK